MSASRQEGNHIVAADYVAGRLSAAEFRTATEHLTQCPHCQAAVEAARSVEARQRGHKTTMAIANFTVRMLVAGATLLAPSVRQLPPSQPPPQPETKPPPSRVEPLRVLQPHLARGVQRLISRFGIVLLLTIGVLLLPTPSGLSPEGHRALAAFVFTSGVLALEPVALPIAALMVPVAVVALGVGTTTEAFATFSRPVVFLILTSLFLAEALSKHGLTRRLALFTTVSSGGGVPALLLGLMAITGLLSMWVGNTATTAMLIPVALTISSQLQDRDQARRLVTLLALGIAYSASLGGMVTIMGAASNAVASGFLAQIQAWSFVDWMQYGLPSFLIMFPLTWWLLLRLVPVDVRRLDIEPARRELKKLGSMSEAERQILGTIIVAAFFWVAGSFIEPLLGLPPTLLSAAMVAVIAVAYLAIRQVIDWEDVKGVSWGIFLVIGAGLSLGEALSRSGATDWFADLIVPVVGGLPFLVSLLILVYLSAILTNVMNNTTIAAVFTPILISLSQADPSLSAVQLVIPVTLATTFGYSLPSASARMALLAATNLVDRSVMMRNGLIVTLISSGVLGLFFYVLVLLNLI